MLPAADRFVTLSITLRDFNEIKAFDSAAAAYSIDPAAERNATRSLRGNYPNCCWLSRYGDMETNLENVVAVLHLPISPNR
jgi:hypothetical protein